MNACYHYFFFRAMLHFKYFYNLMIEQRDKNILFLITAILDICFITILLRYKLVFFDNIFSIVILLFHFLFFYSLMNNNSVIISKLHYLIFVSLGVSIFLTNIYLLSLCLFLTVVIQILWIFEKRCILCDVNETFGFTNEIEVFMLFLTCVLSIKIGSKSTNKYFGITFS